MQRQAAARRHRQSADEVGGLRVRPEVRILNRPGVFEVIPIIPATGTLEQAVVAVTLICADDILQRLVTETPHVLGPEVAHRYDARRAPRPFPQRENRRRLGLRPVEAHHDEHRAIGRRKPVRLLILPG